MKPGDYRVALHGGGTMRVTLASVDPRRSVVYLHCERPEFHDDWVPPEMRRHRTLYTVTFQNMLTAGEARRDSL